MSATDAIKFSFGRGFEKVVFWIFLSSEGNVLSIWITPAPSRGFRFSHAWPSFFYVWF